VVALGHLAIVAGRQDQELPALSPVRTGVAQVGHVTEPEVVEDAEGVRRALHHHRPVLQIEPGHSVDTLGVGCQEQCSRIHQALEDTDRAVDTSHLAQALTHRVERGDGQAVKKRTHAALEIEIVVNRVDGFRARIAVKEREGPQAGLDAVWCQDGLRRGLVLDRRHFRGLCLVAARQWQYR
jgi:hypothetical protein